LAGCDAQKERSCAAAHILYPSLFTLVPQPLLLLLLLMSQFAIHNSCRIGHGHSLQSEYLVEPSALVVMPTPPGAQGTARPPTASSLTTVDVAAAAPCLIEVPGQNLPCGHFWQDLLVPESTW
jgi:hypothetical protein